MSRFSYAPKRCKYLTVLGQTLPSRQVLNSSVHTSPFTSPALQSAALPDDTEETPLLRPPSPPPLRIQTPQLLIVLLNYAIFTFLALSLTATFSLFLHLPIGAGGLSLNPATIGLILGVVGILIGLIQAVLFSKVYKKWGCKKVFRVSVVVFVLIYACMPVMAAISANAGGYTPLVWVLLVFLLFLQAVPPAGFSECSNLTFLHQGENCSEQHNRLYVYIHHPRLALALFPRQDARDSPNGILNHGCSRTRKRNFFARCVPAV